MAIVTLMPKRFCPGMPTVRLELAGGARAIEVEPCTPESVERAKDAQRRERLAHGLCVACGTPLPPPSSQPCAACVLARFSRLAGLES